MNPFPPAPSRTIAGLLLGALTLGVAGGLLLFLPEPDGTDRSETAWNPAADADNSSEEPAHGSGTDDTASAADAIRETERLADAADGQLKQLAALLDATGGIRVEALRPLVTAAIRSSLLRPDRFEERFRTPSLTVRHGLASEDSANASGVDSFAAGLNRMSEPLAGTDRRHSKFKIVSVELNPAAEPRMTTDVLFQRVGLSADGSFQQDATWQCVWTIGPGGEAGSAALPTVRLDQVSLRDYEEVVCRMPQQSLFSDCTESIFRHEPVFRKQLLPGIDYWRSLIQKQYEVFPFGHHGVAVGDVNGDGLDDLYAGQPAGLPNRLFVQNREGTVSDVAAAAGVDLLNRTRGVLLIDVDNDGDQDLVAVLEDVILFLSNDGKTHFTEEAAVPTSEPGSLAAADYDLDGDLDIYVVNYADRFLSSPDVYHDANNGGANVLLRNDGDWTFTDVTRETGLDENNRRWSFAASWEDCDNDGDPDLYVANDFGRNSLYQNQNGRFIDIAPQAGVEDVAAGMSVSWADYDHDGRMDLYVGNMFSSAGLRITGQSRFQQRAPSNVRSEFRRHARGSSLFRNVGNSRFEDVSVDAGVTVGRWAWASKFVDLNNDGWEDLVVANGFVTGHRTKDL